MDCSPSVSSVHGILQSRILECIAIPFSEGSSWLRGWTRVSWIGMEILYHLATREALIGVTCNSRSHMWERKLEENIRCAVMNSSLAVGRRGWSPWLSVYSVGLREATVHIHGNRSFSAPSLEGSLWPDTPLSKFLFNHYWMSLTIPPLISDKVLVISSLAGRTLAFQRCRGVSRETPQVAPRGGQSHFTLFQNTPFPGSSSLLSILWSKKNCNCHNKSIKRSMHRQTLLLPLSREPWNIKRNVERSRAESGEMAVRPWGWCSAGDTVTSSSLGRRQGELAFWQVSTDKMWLTMSLNMASDSRGDPGEGRGNPLQCSCLVNPTDPGTWRVTVHTEAT